MKIFIFSIILTISLFAHADAVKTITCRMDDQAGKIVDEKLLEDSSTSYPKGKFKTLTDGKKSVSVACGIESKGLINCTAIKDSKTMGFSGFITLGIQVDDISLTCFSVDSWIAIRAFMEKDGSSASTINRTLTKDELNFCSRLQDFGSSLLNDYRFACVSFLKTLPRALTQTELDYCLQQYSVQGIGYDLRLMCTAEMM
ncbi:MAG: hypothetical protein AB7I27_09315 [Bacteriovoracaceae bacterium]